MTVRGGVEGVVWVWLEDRREFHWAISSLCHQFPDGWMYVEVRCHCNSLVLCVYLSRCLPS